MTTSSPNRPTHRLYSVCKLKDGKSKWTEIGVAFPNKDGKGFSFKLTAKPAPGGQFIMRLDTSHPAAPQAEKAGDRDNATPQAPFQYRRLAP